MTAPHATSEIARNRDSGAGAYPGALDVSSLNCRPAYTAGRILWDGVDYLTPVRLTHCAWRYHNIKQWCRYAVMPGRDFCAMHPL